jgi:hypothetical protein
MKNDPRSSLIGQRRERDKLQPMSHIRISEENASSLLGYKLGS